jgi:shikimate kinase
MAKPLVLVGMMGSGKTTVGKRLAAKLSYEFVDTDDLVVARAGKAIRDVFAEDGEPEFRRLESLALHDALVRTDVVVAAAGGTVLSAENRSLMTEHARCVVWLDADVGTLAKRTMGGVHRPLLDEQPQERLMTMDAQRRSLYEAVANVRVDTAGKRIEVVVDEVVAALSKEFAS